MSVQPARTRQLHRRLVKFIERYCPNPQTGLEIGVDRAETTVALLTAFPNLHMTLIDPWKSWHKGSHYARSSTRTGRLTQTDWDARYADAMRLLSRFAGRYTVGRMTSMEALESGKFNQMYDFTFVDACHTELHVRQDVQGWLPLTRRLMCGHDYGGRQRGVKRAVDKMFDADTLRIDASTQVWMVPLEHVDGDA